MKSLTFYFYSLVFSFIWFSLAVMLMSNYFSGYSRLQNISYMREFERKYQLD